MVVISRLTGIAVSVVIILTAFLVKNFYPPLFWVLSLFAFGLLFKVMRSQVLRQKEVNRFNFLLGHSWSLWQAGAKEQAIKVFNSLEKSPFNKEKKQEAYLELKKEIMEYQKHSLNTTTTAK